MIILSSISVFWNYVFLFDGYITHKARVTMAGRLLVLEKDFAHFILLLFQLFFVLML